MDLAKGLIHDFVIKNINYLGLITFFSITLIILLVFFFLKIKDRLIIYTKNNQIFSLSLLFIIFIAISQCIDVFPARFEQPYWTKVIESMFEMYAAMALFTINIILKKRKNIN